MTDNVSGAPEHVTDGATDTSAPRVFTAPLGGVMTREVGAITGDLEVWIDPEDGEKTRIRYVGAEDVYTVKGRTAGRSIEDVVTVLSADPGVDADDNPRSTDLGRP